ncbi:hypothetical protein ACV1DV_06315 [Aeromonas veronii]
MIDIPASGSSTGSFNASLPRPPRKAARNVADVSAVTVGSFTSGKNGRWAYTYHFWDVSDVLPNHLFGISSGATKWGPSAVMALRNNITGLTVWTKAYSTLGTSGPQAGVFDLAAGFFYVFTGATTELRLWKINISTGAATLVASDAGVKCPGFQPTDYPTMMFARFISSDIIEFVYFVVYGTSARAATVNVKTGQFTDASPAFLPSGYAASGESFTYPSLSQSSSVSASIQYITKDKKASLAFTPSRLLDLPTQSSGTDAGDRGAIRTVMVTRGLARATLSIVDPGYHIPYRYDSYDGTSAQVMMTDKTGAIAMVKEITQYIPAWDGRFDFYDQSDLDRWVNQIADEAGLPAGTPWW